MSFQVLIYHQQICLLFWTNWIKMRLKIDRQKDDIEPTNPSIPFKTRPQSYPYYLTWTIFFNQSPFASSIFGPFITTSPLCCITTQETKRSSVCKFSCKSRNYKKNQIFNNQRWTSDWIFWQDNNKNNNKYKLASISCWLIDSLSQIPNIPQYFDESTD